MCIKVRVYIVITKNKYVMDNFWMYKMAFSIGCAGKSPRSLFNKIFIMKLIRSRQRNMIGSSSPTYSCNTLSVCIS